MKPLLSGSCRGMSVTLLVMHVVRNMWSSGYHQVKDHGETVLEILVFEESHELRTLQVIEGGHVCWSQLRLSATDCGVSAASCLSYGYTISMGVAKHGTVGAGAALTEQADFPCGTTTFCEMRSNGSSN